MKKCLFFLPILALLLQPALVFLPTASAQEGGEGPQAPAQVTLFVKPADTGTGDCSSWDNACTLQTALGTADSGDEIWVQTGIYKPTTGSDRTVSFALKSGVAIYGGFAGTETSREQRDWETNLTTLSGDIGAVGNSDNSYHVVYAANVDALAVLDGFTITAGNANVEPTPSEWGGGMYLVDSNLTIRNVSIENNSARGGGGIFISGGAPALEEVEFAQNTATVNGGGLHTLNNASLTLMGVTFSGNSAAQWGGGMFNYGGSSATLTDVTFSANTATWGGGMFNYSGSATLTNATFSANTAADSSGGMFNYDFGSATLTNATFSGNTATWGGGMRNNGTATLTNATFSANTATWGGGMYSQSGSATLTNAILWGNTPEQIYGAAGTVGVSYSDVQGGCPASASCDHLISSDPLFVDAAGGNLRLQLNSPAIDAGNNAAVPVGVLSDLDGYSRFADIPGVRDPGAIVDMGAYEAQNVIHLPLLSK